MKRRVTFALTSALALVGLLLSAEFGARVYLAQRQILKPKPEPTHFDNVKVHMESFGLLYDDYQDGEYSITNGVRTTTGQPLVYTHTLWIFGNSGLFDAYSPDDLTMTSDLQAMLPHTRVMNMSMWGQFASYELARLKATPVHPGDTVLFIDGISDEEASQRSCPRWFDHLSSTAIYQLVCQILPAHEDALSISRYWHVIDEANAAAHAYGAGFDHLIQACSSVNPVPTQGYHLYAPDNEFVNTCHLNAAGDLHTAHEVWNYLSVF